MSTTISISLYLAFVVWRWHADRVAEGRRAEQDAEIMALKNRLSGGGGSIVGVAGSGGNAGNYGAGGGGGGASLNGNNSGAGGNGSGGLVVLVEIYD